MNLNEARWRKSSYSANGGSECVEVAWVDTATAVRDSKNPAVTPLVFPATAWRRFARQADSDFGSGRTSSSSLSA
ncbi:MAG TPA: DUF397 domain-containing protein [Pseudonocardiaceae bacterium]|nr:DUF397 domain-containing protein [Pseudonocardiaceae bacterium]